MQTPFKNTQVWVSNHVIKRKTIEEKRSACLEFLPGGRTGLPRILIYKGISSHQHRRGLLADACQQTCGEQLPFPRLAVAGFSRIAMMICNVVPCVFCILCRARTHAFHRALRGRKMSRQGSGGDQTRGASCARHRRRHADTQTQTQTRTQTPTQAHHTRAATCAAAAVLPLTPPTRARI